MPPLSQKEREEAIAEMKRRKAERQQQLDINKRKKDEHRAHQNQQARLREQKKQATLQQQKNEEDAFKKQLKQIAKSKTEEQFLLASNIVGDEHAKALADALKTNEKITEFIFVPDQSKASCNEFTMKGAMEILTAFRENFHLQRLDIHSNRLGAELFQILAILIAESALRELNCSANAIDDTYSESFFRCLSFNRTLTKLLLRENYLGEKSMEALAQLLASNNTLEELDLHYNVCETRAIETLMPAVAENKTLKKLWLGRNQLNHVPAGVPNEKQENPETKIIANYLRENTSLVLLELSYSNINDVGAKYLEEMLSKNNTLETLDLSGNNIHDPGAVQLATALDNNTRLKHLILAKNQIGEKGVVALSRTLAVNNSLVELDLTDNRLNDKSLQALVALTEKNDCLHTLKVGEASKQVGKQGRLALKQLHTIFEFRFKLFQLFNQAQKKLQSEDAADKINAIKQQTLEEAFQLSRTAYLQDIYLYHRLGYYCREILNDEEKARHAWQLSRDNSHFFAKCQGMLKTDSPKNIVEHSGPAFSTNQAPVHLSTSLFTLQLENLHLKLDLLRSEQNERISKLERELQQFKTQQVQHDPYVTRFRIEENIEHDDERVTKPQRRYTI